MLEQTYEQFLISVVVLILPDGGVQPDGLGPSCLGGLGIREDGINLSTKAYSSVDSITPVVFAVFNLAEVCLLRKDYSKYI